MLAFRAGAQTESQDRNEAALEAARAVGDGEAEALTRDLDAAAGVAPLHMLAAGTRLAGDYDEAIQLYAESLELNRRLGDSRVVGMELHNIGHVELHRGNVDDAERCFAECADVRNHDDRYEAAMTHLNHAALAFARCDRERAAELLLRTQSTLDGAGIVLDPDDAFEVEWLRDQLR